jgi:serine/threonine protein kinase
MALSPSTKLGPYEILSPLGAGGMGEVYRARDTKLGREVALKVLPAAMANDPDRMARFQREAQMLASLNHPGIASIYGLEESGSVRALVMELVEGQTLADNLETRHAVPLQDALPIARQIAEALEYAHERGIIHRDLKPANIKITPEGSVKILDFGLAKALDTGDFATNISNSPTLTVAATQAGVILGTAAYMSPEQARGKRADRRADIWAFGVVLYELLTGAQAFGGETTTDTLAAVLRTDPNLDALPAGIPATLRRLLERCLDKEPRRRLQAIGEARIAIEESLSGDVEAGISRPPEGGGVKPLLRRVLPWAAAAILISMALFGGWWLRGRRATPPTRWSGDLLGGSSIAIGPRISPDGHALAFQAFVDNQTQLAVMNPDSGNWTVLTHGRSSGTLQEISWSPDGSKLYFDRVSSRPLGIYTVPSLGGDERLVLKDAASPEALPDGSLLVWRIDAERKSRIYHFWPDSGRLQPLEGWIPPTLPVALIRVFPDGKEAVFYGMTVGTDASPHLYALEIATGKARRLAAQLPIRQTSEGFPLAPTPDNRSVLIDLPSGNLHQIVAIPRSGSGPVPVLMTLTTPPWLMDAGPDGSIYLDQVGRPIQALRFTVSGGIPEVLATTEARALDLSAPVEFTDGRFLIPAFISGRSQLLIGKMGGNFYPLVDTVEETRLPAALLPDNQVAFIAGTGSDQTIGIASAGEGRIIRRLNESKGVPVTSLAASPDGKTLYYTADGTLWAIPANGATPRKVSAGDGVAVDPNGKGLIVNLVENTGVHLVRIPLAGGQEQAIQVQGDISMDPLPLGGNSFRKDGKLLVGVTPTDSWFFSPAVLDVASGKLTRIPLNFTGDTLMLGWSGDGRVLALGELMRAHIWRFRPVP